MTGEAIYQSSFDHKVERLALVYCYAPVNEAGFGVDFSCVNRGGFLVDA